MNSRTRRTQPRTNFRFFGGQGSRSRTIAAVMVSRLLTRPDITLSRLVMAIDGDPLFARRVRNMAKARSASRFKVKTTRDAVSVMGFTALGRLANEYAGGAAQPSFA